MNTPLPATGSAPGVTRRTLSVAAAAILAGRSVPASAAGLPTRQDPRLIPVYQSNRVWNGVTTTRDGRVFVSLPSADRPGVQLQELGRDGTATPYPDADWNRSDPSAPLQSRFLRVNALRIGPDGMLWVVDAGAPGIGKPAVPGAARLFRIDLSANRIDRTIDLAPGIRPMSYIDDIRFNGPRIYVSDAGAPGMLVVDAATGAVRRLLDNDPALTDTRTMRADGKVLRSTDGKELRVHADQLEVSPDGRWLYIQPSSGPLARIPTQALDDPAVTPATLAAAVGRNWVDTPTTGGTAIDAAGTIYLSDTDRRRILTISPGGKVATLVSDPRLIWSDAMWIDDAGFLWIPATQQNLTPGFQSGRQSVQYPVWIYKMQVGARPAPNDHS